MTSNKRLLLLIGGTVALILALFGLILLQKNGEVKVTTRQAIPRQLPFSPNITSVGETDSGQSLLFSNGRYIVLYDSATHKTKQLSNTQNLPPITDIIMSADSYLAFQTEEQVDNPSLMQLLGADALVDVPTWWVINLKTLALTPVGQSIDTAEWDSNNLLILQGQTVSSFNPESGQKKTLYSKAPVEDFHKEGGALLIKTTSSKVVSFDIRSGEEKTIDNKVAFAIFDRSSACFLSITAKKDVEVSDVSLENCPPVGNKKLAPVGSGFLGFSDDGKDIVYEEDGNIISMSKRLDAQLSTTIAGSLGSSLDLKKAFSKDVLLLGDGSLYYITSYDTPKLISDDEKFSDDGMSFELYSSDQSITVTKPSDFSGADIIQAGKTLAKHGYDINLYQVIFGDF